MPPFEADAGGHVFSSRSGLLPGWCFLRFLDKTVKQENSLTANSKQTTGDARIDRDKVRNAEKNLDTNHPHAIHTPGEPVI